MNSEPPIADPHSTAPLPKLNSAPHQQEATLKQWLTAGMWCAYIVFIPPVILAIASRVLGLNYESSMILTVIASVLLIVAPIIWNQRRHAR